MKRIRKIRPSVTQGQLFWVSVIAWLSVIAMIAVHSSSRDLYRPASITRVDDLEIEGTTDATGEVLAHAGLRLTSSSGPIFLSGTGSPDTVVSATVGSMYLRTDVPSLWQNSNGATTWTQVGAGGSSGAFSGASVYNTTNQSIPPGTYTAITYNSERLDVGGYHSTSSDTTRLTAPTTGYYRVKVAIGMATNSGNRYVKIRKNGTTDLSGDVTWGTNTNFMVDETITQLNAGDYVEAYVFQSTVSSVNVLGTPLQTFDINYIGN